MLVVLVKIKINKMFVKIYLKNKRTYSLSVFKLIQLARSH